MCQDCAVGYYGDAEGLGECKACEAGKFSGIISSSSCSLCPMGMFAFQPHIHAKY